MIVRSNEFGVRRNGNTSGTVKHDNGIDYIFKRMIRKCSELQTQKCVGKGIGKKGFTLIEIIVVIVIAGILLPVIVVPFVSAVKGSGKPEMATTAIYLAHQKMEGFMKFNYNDPTLNTTALTPYANADIPSYQWQWEIVYVDSNFNPSATDLNYKRILVRVRDPNNDTYEVYSVVTNFP
jgi:prepilin-type N-terminal cleavage/methylation domain-containing protein